MLKAVDAIAEVNPHADAQRHRFTGNPSDGATTTPSGGGGGYEPDIIVLLTDGAATQGVDPMVAAQQAADRRIRVYTIGFGTTNPAALSCSREQLGSDVLPGRFGGAGGFGGPGPGGAQGGRGRNALQADEQTLQKIADITGGSYHQAGDAGQLKKVFQDLPNDVTVQKEEQEVSVVFVAIGGLAAMVGVALSLLWNRYP